jgi:hypothetical protein
MKSLRFGIALALLILPSVARGWWLYGSRYTRPSPVALPEYSGVTVSLPPLATPQAPEPAAEMSGKIVLMDLAHENLYNVSELEALTQALMGLGARLQTLEDSHLLGQSLKRADAYVTVAPATTFTPDEVSQVQRFVEQGGRVLVLADPTRSSYLSDGLAGPNSLLAPFDLSFADDYLYNLVENEGNYRNVLLKKFADSPLTAGLTTTAFYATRSVNTSSGTPLILADEQTLSSRTDASGNLAAAALSANGQVLALGDLTFITAPYYQVADNSRLIAHIAEFLTGGERRYDLADAPFVFTRPVVILPTEGVTLTAGLVKSLGQLQMALKSADVPSSIADDPVAGSDLIVLGSYTPGRDLLRYLLPFAAELKTAPESKAAEGKSNSIFVPGVGNVDKAGTGLMLFSRTDERATLVLLASDPDSLSDLVSVLAAGGQPNCVFQEQGALCNLVQSDSSRGTSPPLPSSQSEGENALP